MKFNRFFQDTRMYRDSIISDIQPEYSTPLEFNMPPKFARFDESEVWIDNRIPEEINKIIVPDTISRMGLKIQLLLNGITIADIIDTINSIPTYMFPEQQKQIAIIKFNEAAYFDRYNADLQLVATLMGLSQENLDTMFINGKSS